MKKLRNILLLSAALCVASAHAQRPTAIELGKTGASGIMFAALGYLSWHGVPMAFEALNRSIRKAYSGKLPTTYKLVESGAGLVIMPALLYGTYRFGKRFVQDMMRYTNPPAKEAIE